MNYHIRKILVPLDLSETSLNALESAVALAARHDAQIILLHVHETSFDTADDKFSSLYTSHVQSDVLAAILSGLEQRCAIRPELIQESGSVAELITKIGLHQSIDVVVMGTHGASGYRSDFIG